MRHERPQEVHGERAEPVRLRPHRAARQAAPRHQQPGQQALRHR